MTMYQFMVNAFYQHCKRRDRSYRGYYYRLRDPVDQKQDDRRTV